MKVTFTLSEELSRRASSAGPALPTQHRVVMQPIARQTLSVFSEGVGETREVNVEGKVSQRADIQPVDNAAYMKLKQ